MFSPIEVLWAFIGLVLTIGGTFLEAFITGVPLSFWVSPTVPLHSLGVTCQVGAVLMVGCLGGKNAGAMSQIAYLGLGLTYLQIFAHGGGLSYLGEPTFGYLLGFVPGAWLCGWMAFHFNRTLETLAVSCLYGLFAIHLTGISYLTVIHWLDSDRPGWGELGQLIFTYSIADLPGQLALVCAVTVITFVLRNIMFY
ncbi:MAG: biotin transporter BioY [Leptolyngbyaceae bacterium]|nr:biotin transporter BioY [Leptolyngbyaceae bacterium]